MRSLVHTFLAALIAATVAPVAQAEHAEAPPALPAPDLRVFIEPTATPGTWRMTVLNADDTPVRILADSRKLSLLVRAPGDKDYTTCVLPASMRGADTARQLVLEPGRRYVEFFDPRLICWGSDATKLRKGASVTAFLGHPLDAKRLRRNKPQVAPFFAEPVAPPAHFAPVKRVASLTTWLDRDVPVPVAEQPSDNAATLGVAVLRLRTPGWSEAIRHGDARLTATVRNAGERAALMHLRPDDLEIAVTQPNGGRVVCGPALLGRAAVRDFFQTIRPGKTATVQLLLQEACPAGTFDLPGLYELAATLHVRETGAQLGLDAYTGVVKSPRPTFLRIQQGKLPFHGMPPRAEGR